VITPYFDIYKTDYW